MKGKVMLAAVTLLLLVLAGSTLGEAHTVRVDEITRLQVGYPLAKRQTQAWTEIVKEANRQVSHGLVGKIRPRVRVLFPSGGWVEFRPDANAILSDKLPTLVEIQFAPPPRRETAITKGLRDASPGSC